MYLRDVPSRLCSGLEWGYGRTLPDTQPFPKGLIEMKNPFEVLKNKEQEVVKVRKEIDALRVTIRLIGDENLAQGDSKVDLRSVVEMP